jgi:Leucine-rich repeat (LRR) protein
MTHLRELSLQNCRLLDADILGLKPSSSLIRIQVDQNPLTDQSVLHLAQLPNLEVLDLQSCVVTDASLRILGQCRKLSQLRLESIRRHCCLSTPLAIAAKKT